MTSRSLVATALACLTFSAHGSEGSFDSNGVKIRYVVEGQGEPIILIHGWMGDSSMWGVDRAGNTKLTALPGFQAIALDCRGHGKSEKPHDGSRYGAEMAEDVVRLLDHLKLKKAHLIGYSMGAFIAGNVAANHADRVLSVIYGGQSPLIIGAKSSGSNEVEAFAKAVDAGKGLGPYLLEVWPADKPRPTLAQANAYTEYLYKGKDLKAFAVSGLSLGALNVRIEDLKKCKVPTMFIYGGKESNNLKERVEALRKALGRGEVKVIEGADHVSTLGKPEFGASIVEFLIANKSGF